MKKILLIGIPLILLVVIAGIIYIFDGPTPKNTTPSPVVQESIPTNQSVAQPSPNEEAKTPISPVQKQTPTPLLEASAYVDYVNKFSIRTPRNWVASTTDGTLTIFYHPSTENDPDRAELKVATVVRDSNVNETLETLGQDELANQIIGTLAEDRNDVDIVSTKKVMINGVLYYQAFVTYLSLDATARIKILVNVTFTPSTVVMLAAETYASQWDSKQDAIMESIGTFKLI